MVKFDSTAATTESIIVKYFEEHLKPSIKVEIDWDKTQLDIYDKLLGKTVKAKAKAGLQPNFYVRKTDHQCL